MQLTALSLALSRIMGGGAWSPLSLFAAGEQGAWYQPSDLSTLFQDSAGTTPVTAVEQRVGLMLDKSQGLALGSELVTNGDFSNGTTGWTGSTSSLSVVGGQLVATSITTYGIFYPSSAITTVPNTWYKVSFDVLGSTFLGMRVGTYNSGSDLGGIIGVGQKTYNVFFKATTTTSYLWFQLDGTSGGSCTFDNISVKRIAGNHAFQATTTPNDKRPILSARVNLLTKTEQFDDSAWVKVSNNATVNPNIVSAPDGTLTADALLDTATNNIHYAVQTPSTSISNSTVVVSVYAKAATLNYVTVGVSDLSVGTTYAVAVFNLSNGTVSTTGASGTGYSVSSANIVGVGSGWYRCIVTCIIGTATAFLRGAIGVNKTGIITSSAGGMESYLGNGSGVYIWGADLRPANIGNNIPAYQRVNTATDYDTAGFPYYLKADGTYTSMSTNSIDFSTTDKMTVVSGVRKLSDAATGRILELSGSANLNNGAFNVSAPSVSVDKDIGLYLRGSTNLAVEAYPYGAPTSNIVTFGVDIAGATPTEEVNPVRINGANPTNRFNSGGAGTGNFGNYPLYLLARNNASDFLNGYFYGAIIRGATTSGNDLISAESYMNNQSGGLY